MAREDTHFHGPGTQGAGPDILGAHEELQREAGRYREEALAPHTRRAYRTARAGERSGGLNQGEALKDHPVWRKAILGAVACGPGVPTVPGTGTAEIIRQDCRQTGGSPLFVMEKVTAKKGTVVPMTHEVLVAGIKALAQQVGLDPGSYAGHSLRRGGATAALRLDVNNIYIKLQGDWKSDCFEGYCDLDQEQKLILPVAMAEAAAAACR
ncbi:hypothetical protein CYMTET_43646 [Cymbomonas tetramitiformis]|uniref:Tyr recombinase domain-containing protein n=1 Tax=Cymbomonas tetramitiformis TaxID=36881 RepID=A0AAE0EZS3_9CHLO|nr:hypothetical protein CYMTET_43646 [Cymbomonas tetramitiformis]